MPRWDAGGGGSEFAVNAFGAEPASPTTGDVNNPPGSPFYQRWSGSEWAQYELTHHAALTTVPTSGWTWRNQGGASVATTYGGRRMVLPTSAADLRLEERTCPATPWTLDALVRVSSPVIGTFVRSGIIIMASGGRAYFAGMYVPGSGSSTKLEISQWSAVGTFSSQTLITEEQSGTEQVWIRVTDNGTNLVISFSRDGITYHQALSETRATWLTGGPSTIGYGGSCNNATYAAGSWLLSWSGVA